jgi:hypothetical protein
MTKCGWRVNPWREEAGGFSRDFVYKLIKQGKLETIKVGKARVILTPPQEFIDKYKLSTAVDK